MEVIFLAAQGSGFVNHNLGLNRNRPPKAVWPIAEKKEEKRHSQLVIHNFMDNQ